MAQHWHSGAGSTVVSVIAKNAGPRCLSSVAYMRRLGLVGDGIRSPSHRNSQARPRARVQAAVTAWPTPLIQRRGLFGIGEIVGVLTNPAEVLRSLSESKRLLEEARQELRDNAERAQIPVSHTFSPLPGFYPRPRELQALERALGSVPSLTVLFGASSVGKTALCRQVLSDPKYHCIHFDLRLSGFADLQSLYFSLAGQMESYFASMPDMLGKEWGWDAFEKESYAFKHDKMDVEKRVANGDFVKTADIARLLEFFQSALLKYWDFEPMTEQDRKAQADGEDKGKQKAKARKEPSPRSDNERVERKRDGGKGVLQRGPTPTPSKEEEADLLAARTVKEKQEKEAKGKEAGAAKAEIESEVDSPEPPPKKIPVLFLDEAHKLPALIQSDSAMKTILDSMLVLTKQDRLCHVIHATSDPFYMHWLRQMNVMQHANILSIGDCSKQEAESYFRDVLIQHVPEKLRSGLDFERVYEVFGGKLAHISDYTTEYINSDGTTRPQASSHFVQAHSLLNLQLIHSMPLRPGESDRSGSGFEIYSALSQASPHAAPSPFVNAPSPSNDQGSPEITSSSSPFSSADLLLVMARLTHEPCLAYFPLCRELGARAVDGMVRGRVLELRWSKTVTPEGDERDEKQRDRQSGGNVGPIVVPTTPVVRYAMRQVLREYVDELEEAHGSKWDEEWAQTLRSEAEEHEQSGKAPADSFKKTSQA